MTVDIIYLVYILAGIIVLMILFFSLIIKNKNRQLREMYQQTKQQSSDIGLLKEDISKFKAHLEEKEHYIESLKKICDERSLSIKELQEKNIHNEAIIATLNTTIKEQKKSMDEKLKLLEENRDKLTKEFHYIANKVLENNSKKFTEQSSQGVKELITPVKLQLEEFKKRVDDIYDKESKERNTLLYEIKTLKELNEKMSQDAINLTNALKGESKQQGTWGEMILERVLESSGLREGEEYKREVVLKSGNGEKFRPDVIVNLPGDRQIIIDAKTSLTHYEQYISSEDEESKKRYLSLHLNSIKDHIKELSKKDYEKLQGINSLDFVFMFIPVEGALLLALKSDPALYDKAFKEHIVLVSPTTLLVALRAVENSWRYEKQARNIKEVTLKAEKLYSKFVGFLKDFESIGKSIKKSEESYNEALKKLSTGRGNIIRQITLFKDSANISPKNEIPQELVDASMVEMVE
jgi:DNA recombination protein RmuC